MSRLFSGTSLDRPLTCERCGEPLDRCACPRTSGGSILLPKDQQARVRREKRRGKFVTVISGLDPAASDLPGLLKTLRTKYGAGGTISDNELELQGDHKDKLIELLKSMGYPAKGAGG
ncbi:MAG: translation initiation factor [Pyrinomonadaceae bacterium]|nr:translation initiation factor [Phycisphaerales bacterium]